MSPATYWLFSYAVLYCHIMYKLSQKSRNFDPSEAPRNMNCLEKSCSTFVITVALDSFPNRGKRGFAISPTNQKFLLFLPFFCCFLSLSFSVLCGWWVVKGNTNSKGGKNSAINLHLGILFIIYHRVATWHKVR